MAQKVEICKLSGGIGKDELFTWFQAAGFIDFFPYFQLDTKYYIDTMFENSLTHSRLSKGQWKLESNGPNHNEWRVYGGR